MDDGQPTMEKEWRTESERRGFSMVQLQIHERNYFKGQLSELSPRLSHLFSS